MDHKIRFVTISLLVTTLLCVPCSAVHADDDHKQKKWYGKIWSDDDSIKAITEIPYLLNKHHEIPPDVFKRESIGSFSNCAACQTNAGDGIYDDDNVRIPR